jgi:hypothetical protein
MLPLISRFQKILLCNDNYWLKHCLEYWDNLLDKELKRPPSGAAKQPFKEKTGIRWLQFAYCFFRCKYELTTEVYYYIALSFGNNVYLTTDFSFICVKNLYRHDYITDINALYILSDQCSGMGMESIQVFL